MAQYKLISFKLCPFVQRSVIVLKLKKIPFEVLYIDLKNKPEWFLKISPTGKVPVLQVGEEVIFESSVINEFLDETNPPSLHPADPIQKAKNRAWIEFFSNLFTQFYQMCHAKTREEYETFRKILQQNLKKVEAEVQGTFFNGDFISLADCAIAPLFSRIEYLNSALGDFYSGMDKLKEYANRLASLPEVKESVLPEVPNAFREHIYESQSFLAKFL